MVPTTRIAIALWLWATASQALAQGDACAYAVNSKGSMTPKTSQISVVGMAPPEGASVRRETVLAVDLDFEIAGFQPESFFLYATFPTTAADSIGPHSMIPQPLETAAGRARLCIPLADIYENPRVRWPLTMYLNIFKARSLGAQLVAYTAPIKLKSPDVPQDALERQAAALPLEYYESLTKVTEFFDTRLARYKICIERFPAIQPQITPAYRAWEIRHREQIDFVSRIQFDAFKVAAEGHAGLAASAQDDLRDAALEIQRKVPEAQFRQQCKVALADFADTEDLSDLAISDELELIRKHNPQPAGNAR